MRFAILLCLCALALQGALPFAFFRRGRITAGWLLTAAPFATSAVALLAGLAEVIEPLALPAPLPLLLAVAAIPLAAAAITLIALTVRVHRAPVSLWHQEDDQPTVVVTGGPYAYVRHPFYAAFIVLLAACAASFPHPATFAAAVFGVLQLNRTAQREERRLLASPLGAEYAAVMLRNGRFLPRVRPRVAAAVSRRRVRGRSRPVRRAWRRQAS